jgi:membrane protein DedA with SNARE-associated domain
MVNDLLDALESISSSPWFYLAIFAVAYLDSVLPIVPGETTVILGGIAAGQDELSVLTVIACGAIGAFTGDTTSYLIGRRASGPLQRTVLSSGKWQGRLAAASRQLQKRGGPLLITARFIPGGRTAITLSSGVTERPYVWFARWVAVAAVIWASYAAGLGYFAGNQFKDDHTTAFLVAFGTALTATGVIEFVRWLRDRRVSRPEGSSGTDR